MRQVNNKHRTREQVTITLARPPKLSNKELRRLAEILPALEVLGKERHWVKGWELIAQGHTEEAGVKIVGERTYEQEMPVILDTNHYKKMKKLQDAYGVSAAVGYYNAVMNLYNEKRATPKN